MRSHKSITAWVCHRSASPFPFPAVPRVGPEKLGKVSPARKERAARLDSGKGGRPAGRWSKGGANCVSVARRQRGTPLPGDGPWPCTPRAPRAQRERAAADAQEGMAGRQKEKVILDEVHQNQILRELYLKELRTQKLYTQYHVNPLRKGEGRRWMEERVGWGAPRGWRSRGGRCIAGDASLTSPLFQEL